MGKGGKADEKVESETRLPNYYDWEQVKQHSSSTDKWIVIENEVYNITEWSRRHPGGTKVISHYAGQDGTEAFRAFHNNVDYVKKYLKPLHVGTIDPKARLSRKDDEMRKDFEELRKTARAMGLFKPSILFFIFGVAHILFCEFLAYYVIATWGIGWLPYTISVLFYTVAQSQMGWTQHDYGHASVIGRRKFERPLHSFLIGFVKGAGADWWSHMHYQHHAKPNVINKDPDVRMEMLFVLGEKMPVKIAKKNAAKGKTMPYNWQHHYFFLLGPPLLFPVYFQFMTFRHTITRRQWMDLFWMMVCYTKILYLYTPYLGVLGTVGFFFLIRLLESHWFTWVSQSNHIVMAVEEDQDRPWLAAQLSATCDIEKSLFNDWFTGHLNFQIEHHLFPTMPRHNLHRIQPLAKSLCEKHGVPYVTKTLGGAFADIIRTLKVSGEMWLEAYRELQT